MKSAVLRPANQLQLQLQSQLQNGIRPETQGAKRTNKAVVRTSVWEDGA